MKFGIRTPSLNKRIAARTSLSRVVRHSMGFKAPRGYGWITNPKRAAYNRVYNRTTFKADNLIALVVVALIGVIGAIIGAIFEAFQNRSENKTAGNTNVNANTTCPRCYSEMILRNGRRGKFYGCSRFPRCRGTRDYVEIVQVATPLTTTDSSITSKVEDNQ